MGFKSEQQRLLERTWKALQEFDLDPMDRESVLKYEKLVKLHLSLSRYLDKQKKDEPETEELVL